MDSLIAVQTDTTPDALHNWLTGVISLARKSYVVMGHLLYELQKDDKFKQAIGKGIEEWHDYLKQPEIGLHPNEANRMIQIYEKFILELGFSEETISSIPKKSMHYILPMAKQGTDRDTLESVMYDAINLSQKDFKDSLYDRKLEGGETDDSYEYMVMRRRNATGTMHRVQEIEHEQIKRKFNLD